MSGNRVAAWLLLLVIPVWAVGFYHSMVEREEQTKQIKQRSARAWYKRYARLKRHLAGEQRAAIVYDPARPRKGNKRLFRAQYMLAPIVIRLRGRRLPEIRPRKTPLIYDFGDQRALDQLLAETAATARQRGVVMETARVARGLALVTMKRGQGWKKSGSGRGRAGGRKNAGERKRGSG